MGQKINPVGFRIGNVYTWSSRWFASGKNFPKYLLEDKNMRLKLGHGAKILAENKSIEALSKKVMDIYAKLG